MFYSGASAGGSPSPANGAASLVGPQWRLSQYRNARGVLSPVVAGTEVTATFDAAGRVSGSGGCNSYSAGYSVNGGGIKIGPAAVTRMFCAQPAGTMDQEQAYLAALAEAATCSVTGTHLELHASDGATLATFVAAQRPRSS